MEYIRLQSRHIPRSRRVPTISLSDPPPRGTPDVAPLVAPTKSRPHQRPSHLIARQPSTRTMKQSTQPGGKGSRTTRTGLS
ncbi:hypothetical protein BD414DRAFT_476621 [Trametes punicea]|nr:hypothetical protein BD414DRAFT_476621 [Trametes punicea]